MPTELPPSFIRARPPGGDPYGLTGGGYRPSGNEFPYRVNNPLNKQMIQKRDSYCSPNWLATFQALMKSSSGLHINVLTEMRILAYADLLRAQGQPLLAAYDQACNTAVPFLYNPHDTLPYPPANRQLSGDYLTVLHALTHSMFGNGEPMDFPLERTGVYVNLTSKQSFMNAVLSASVGSSPIDIRFTHDTAKNSFVAGKTLGHVTLRLQGQLHKSQSGGWVFNDGTLRAFDDYYDANESTHRGFWGEIVTKGLGVLIRKPFSIRIPGELPISASGAVN
ncbi:lipid II-degrading bacteriocin [Pseudomonas quasicaspiana]|uniref:lipid II-degrading bacteriocin n=1 Tax=Pseudomonas quasicaspiana TaxID=2829821 RepID=UPI001E28E3BE|nr:lipid II-degrading bacteriocin [Pseudomonas quasicaspiana]MCD5971735.1 lipid II-degrading bacteriocin [Pseudomonas quasicaspiana]